MPCHPSGVHMSTAVGSDSPGSLVPKRSVHLAIPYEETQAGIKKRAKQNNLALTIKSNRARWGSNPQSLD